jgi:exonuclease VII small subunit
MLKKDWKKEVWELHVAFHETALRHLESVVHRLKSGKPVLADEINSLAEELGKATGLAHSIFDNVVAMVEQLNDQLLKLEGALEEARRRR